VDGGLLNPTVTVMEQTVPEVTSKPNREPSVRPEIFIGLVGAVGTPLPKVAEQLAASLKCVGYQTDTVQVSAPLELLQGDPPLTTLKSDTENNRLTTYMEKGTEVRKRLRRGDALAALAMAQVWALRLRRTESEEKPDADRAYILRSLKNPHEVEALRQVYGEHFTLVGVWAARENRVKNLAKEIAHSEGNLKSDQSRAFAEQRIAVDEQEQDAKFGQNVRDTFPLADYFIDATDLANVEKTLDRLIHLLFGDPFVTPSIDEMAMFHAQAAALRSSALARQIGASIINPEKGDLLSVGMNDVPKAGGGHYWEGDEPDGRDFRLLKDTNDEHKLAIMRQVLKSLRDAGWLKTDDELSLDQLLENALGVNGPFRRTWLPNLTEFGRDVHAEMSAIINAARRGVGLAGSHLYCTTFPCHNCAKHIVAAGIRRVVYIEPYAKSFAREFHLESIDADSVDAPNGEMVRFVPFSGVSPRKYASWFSMVPRKDDLGNAIRWQCQEALPRSVTIDSGYVTREREEIGKILQAMEEAKITASP
jgi:deoxycytidylate deaminase